MPDVDDIALLREYVDGHSESAFAGIVQRRVNLVYSVALRFTGNSEDAQDVTQAVFVILAKKAAGLRPNTILTGWLYEATRFTAMNFLTQKNRRQAREQEAYMQSTLKEAETIWPQLAPLLESAMSRLNEKDRTLVALRFYENRSMAETAALLGVNESAARKRAERAIEKLRHYFSRRGVTSTAETIAGAISDHSIQTAPALLGKTATGVALAKGTAASTSTLTLIKGALKIMAWTKAKTAIVVVAGVLLAAGTTTVTVKQIAAHKAEASWRIPNPDPDRAPLMVEILPTKFPNSAEVMRGRPGHLIGIGKLARQIVALAYQWRPGRIVFEGIRSDERYDFIWTLPQNSETALQAELKRKLGVVVHRETRDADVLLLKVRMPNAPGLQRPTTKYEDYSLQGNYYCDNAPLSLDKDLCPGIARFLEEYFAMPVIDRTGLTQNYHIDLKWNEQGEQDPDHNALKQALLDQLGLELVPSNMPIEMLVVEKAK